jgi:perosamine synthetase
MITLSTPNIGGNEWEYIKECLDTEWVSSAGKYVDLFEEKICEYTGAKYAIACVNGTSALQVSLLLAGVEPDDEVIIPTLTFIAPVNAIAYNNAKPLFMDVDEYYNLDSEKTINFIRTKTKFKNGKTYNLETEKCISAIVPVHMWGNAAELGELKLLCDERKIAIVEDASESLGTYYINGQFDGKHTGTIGKFGCLSFNGNKIITTGGGGAILTNDKALSIKARYLTTQAKDDPVRYIHNEIGFNFRLTNIHAAMGVAQLENLQKFLQRKETFYNYYVDLLKNIDGLSMSRVPSYSKNNHWMSILQIDNSFYKEKPEELMIRLGDRNIQTRPVWRLNHLQKPYKNCQTYKIDNADELVEKSLCLPTSTNLSDNDIKFVVDSLSG